VGNTQLKAAAIRSRTGLEAGGAWLWAWNHTLNGLRHDPWVLAARLERPKLGVVRVVIKERKTIAHLESSQQGLGLAADGTLLPNAPLSGPQIAGDMDFPRADMVTVVQAFPTAERIRYDRAGFSVEGPGVKVWGKTAKELQKIAKGDRIMNGTAGGSKESVFVYSWGVSKRR
jgi:cell division protein FtsQ